MALHQLATHVMCMSNATGSINEMITGNWHNIMIYYTGTQSYHINELTSTEQENVKTG